MSTWADLRDAPDKTSHRRTFDDTSVRFFKPGDVEILHHYADPASYWDGHEYVVAHLADGRYVSWSTVWGPTGTGFHEDAYGGDAEVVFSSTLDTAINFGLTAEGRRALKLRKGAKR